MGKTRKEFLGFDLKLGICADTDERLNGTPTRLSGLNTALCLRLCAGVSPPSAGQKNWVRGVPLLGS